MGDVDEVGHDERWRYKQPGGMDDKYALDVTKVAWDRGRRWERARVIEYLRSDLGMFNDSVGVLTNRLADDIENEYHDFVPVSQRTTEPDD